MSVAPAHPRALDPGVVEGRAVDAVAEARGALREALASRAKLTKAVEKAKSAAARAKVLVSELEAEVERHVGAGRRITVRRTEDLKATLKAGKAPSFEVLAEVPAIEAKRLEAESRLAAAKVAQEELQRDESEAEGALAAGENAVPAAVKGIVFAAATELAERLLELQAEVDDLHERLGINGSRGFLSHYLGPKNGTALSQTMHGQVWEFNGPEWKRSAAYQVKWASFAKALEHSPDAVLELD